jgi:hypothetical protein
VFIAMFFGPVRHEMEIIYIFLARTMYMYALSQSEKVRCAPFESKHIAIKMTREKKKERKQTPQQRTMHTGTKYKQPLSLQQLLIDNKQQTTT